MRIIHISAECYPVAKAGGLGDVVGALPAYLNQKGHQSMVLMPKYDNKWIDDHLLSLEHSSRFIMGNQIFTYHIYKEVKQSLGFDLFFVDIPGLLDRKGIYVDPNSGYSYWDEFERFLAFQIASVDWLNSWHIKPDVVHCHDHHTGLIPFMMNHTFTYQNLRTIPTVLTIHNGQYQGNFDMGKAFHLPNHEPHMSGLLQWENRLNQLASAIKCSWAVTTVSPTYLRELNFSAEGLEPLIQQETPKMHGILNGIDKRVWDPETDSMLVQNYDFQTVKKGKYANKLYLSEHYGFDVSKPLVSFIGRLVGEKGADLMPDLIKSVLNNREDVNFLLLGTGDPVLEQTFEAMNYEFAGRYKAVLKYDEALAHKIYAGSDALLMPSRVEPCGLNQMYALRYGTVPIVRRVGGLNDTVIDFSLKGGTGVHFDHFSLYDAENAINRMMILFSQPKKCEELIKRAMKVDHSWERSADQYIQLYQSLNKPN